MTKYIYAFRDPKIGGAIIITNTVFKMSQCVLQAELVEQADMEKLLHSSLKMMPKILEGMNSCIFKYRIPSKYSTPLFGIKMLLHTQILHLPLINNIIWSTRHST